MALSRNVWFHNEDLLAACTRVGIFWAIPVSWQGWTVLGLYCAGITAIVVTMIPDQWRVALLAYAVLTAAFLLVTVVKGKRVKPYGP